ncbi:MAG: outer membrane protein transport protein [Myxococcales bacterium]|nr:outer membrane protein transport protein [Myxococcales bacterium]MCB9626336.1 outer membrane protein transport protein [Sandaracinaceae bacterium]
MARHNARGAAAALRILCVLCAWWAACPVARANAPEDVQGVGARINGMGGAGTAAAVDFSATYYNPANLSRCANSQLGVDIRHTLYNLEMDDQGPALAGDPDGDPTTDEDYPTPKPLRNQTRVTMGFCNHLPFGLSFGMVFGIGLQNPMTLDQSTLNQRPHWLLYGEQLEALSIALAVSYSPIPELSFGLGASILIHSALSINTGITVLSDTPSEVVFQWDLQPAAAIYFGVNASPVDWLHIGLTYRGALYHDLETPVNIDASALGLAIPIQLFVQSAAWYTPRQVAFGVSAEPISALTLAMDLTWYNYAAHPGPFLVATPDNELTAAAVSFPLREDHGQRNVVVTRLGAELRMLDDALAIRAGYGFRPSAVSRPGTSAGCQVRSGMSDPCRANVLDANTHSIALGVGYRFGDRPDTQAHPLEQAAERTAEDDAAQTASAEPEPARQVAAAPASASNPPTGGQPAWATRGTSAQGPATPAPAPPAAGSAPAQRSAPVAQAGSGQPADEGGRVALDPENQRTYDPHRSVGANAAIDVFFRANMMKSQRVTRSADDIANGIDYWQSYSYGGAVLDIGVTLTIGWY